QPIVFGAAADLAIQENHVDAHALELIDQQDLIGIFAGEAIRRMHLETIDHPRGDQVPQPLQRRADQGRPTIAFIHKLHALGQGQPVGGDAFLQRRHLASDRLRIGLLFRRDPSVHRRVYRAHEAFLLPPGCMPPSPCGRWVGGLSATGRRGIGTPHSYACATQSGVPRLGSNVMWTVSAVGRSRSRRAMTASLLPPRGALTRGLRLQRSASKPVTIPGAQMGPRDVTRELYRQVCNFVGSVTTPPCGVPVMVSCTSSWYMTPARRNFQM